MWNRFVERARRVVSYAQEEAARLGTNDIDTAHLLLGLTREPDTTASEILTTRLGIALVSIHDATERQTPRGDGNVGPEKRLTPAAQRSIQLADEEARALGSDTIHTHHLLLGLLAQGDDCAARVLVQLGVDLERVRREARAVQWQD
jgi:ATP-dependent Clp protease ATP-binding subunit ClpC